MARIITGKELTDELIDIIKEAEEYLVLISPYFKLSQVIKDILSKKLYDPIFELFIVYGKNDQDKRKSLSENDYEFFKKFKNVQIMYLDCLHAKIYFNEIKCILTSLNLHEYSITNNVEVGLLTKTNFLDTITSLTKLFTKKYQILLMGNL